MNALPAAFAPHRLCVTAALLAAAGTGLFIPVMGDLKLQMQVIMAAGLACLATLLVIPNRRIALVCAWVLAHPLSLEKVFQVFSPTYPGFMAPSVVISGSDLVFYLLLGTMLMESIVMERRMFKWSSALLPYVLLVCWVVILFFGTMPTVNGFMQVFHWVKMLLFLVTMSSAVRTRAELLTVLAAMGIAVLLQSGLLVAAYVLKRKIGFSSKVTSESMMVFSGGGGDSVTRATGTVGHVNQQAMFHVFFTMPLAALFMARNWFWRIGAAVVLLASFCAIILTFSRASWISSSLAAGVIVLIAWKYKRINRTGWLALAGGLLAVLVVVGAFSGLIVKRITKGDDGASSSRVRMAMLALDHATSHPLTGVGPGNFVNDKVSSEPIQWGRNVWLPRGKIYAARYLAGLELYEVEIAGKWFYMPGVVHNKLLLMAAEYGLVGLGLFLWFQWRILGHVLRALRTKDKQLWWVAVALMGTFWAIQSEFMFELFYDDKTVLSPLFICALMISVDRLVADEIAREEIA